MKPSNHVTTAALERYASGGVEIGADALWAIEAHLEELEETPTADPQFLVRAEALYVEVEQHLRREENERFPVARGVLSEDEAERLGERAIDLEREWARTT